MFHFWDDFPISRLTKVHFMSRKGNLPDCLFLWDALWAPQSIYKNLFVCLKWKGKQWKLLRWWCRSLQTLTFSKQGKKNSLPSPPFPCRVLTLTPAIRHPLLTVPSSFITSNTWPCNLPHLYHNEEENWWAVRAKALPAADTFTSGLPISVFPPLVSLPILPQERKALGNFAEMFPV